MAFLYLAGKLAKYDLQSITQSKSRSWWKQFVDNLDSQDLDSKGQLGATSEILLSSVCEGCVVLGAAWRTPLEHAWSPFSAAICHQVLDTYGEAADSSTSQV